MVCRPGPDDRDPNAYRVIIIPMAMSALIAAITACLIVLLENNGQSLSKRVELIKRSIRSMLYGSPVLFMAMVCIGVGILQHIVLSWLVCILVSSFVVVPLSMTTRRLTWSVHNLCFFSPQLCCLGGAWFGAIPVSLDWNVPWLRWPLPVALGSMVGHLLGCLVILVIDVVTATGTLKLKS